ncbi:MAG: YhjD/YihY/BrkB family envelope integrity protein, partial [Actinomycetota bacterium]
SEEAERGSAPERIARVRARADELTREAKGRFEQERRRRGWLRLLLHAWERDRDRGGGLLAGGLAYRVFLWELPAALFFVGVAGVVADLASRDPADLLRQAKVSGLVAGTVAKGVEQAGSSRVWVLLAGLVLMLWAARGLKLAIDVTCTIAWRRPARRKVRPAQLVELSGFLLGAILLQTWLSSWLQSGGIVGGALGWVVLSAVTVAVVVVAFILLPHEGGWLHVLPGAIAFALAVRLLNLVVWIYFWHKIEHSSDLYGSLGLSIAILLYLYLLARLFVGAQFVNATLSGVVDEPVDQEALASGAAVFGAAEQVLRRVRRETADGPAPEDPSVDSSG